MKSREVPSSPMKSREIPWDHVKSHGIPWNCSQMLTAVRGNYPELDCVGSGIHLESRAIAIAHMRLLMCHARKHGPMRSWGR